MRYRFNQFETRPIHIVGKTDLPAWPSDMELAWSVFGNVLNLVEDSAGINFHSFVLMRNHFHMIATVENDDEKSIIDWLCECVRLGYLEQTEQIPPNIFSKMPSFFKLDHFVQFKNTYKYVYRNPVEAGLVERVEHYPFSTLSYVLGRRELPFSCQDNMNLITDAIKTLEWLNEGEDLLPSPFYH